MQTIKNAVLRQGPAPFKAPNQKLITENPTIFVKDNQKWLIEHQNCNNNLIIDEAEINNVVYLYKCNDCIVTIKGTINSIFVDSCKKVSVVFDSVMACVEFNNCESTHMQVFGKVPKISIRKCEGCQIYLSPDSLDVKIITSESSKMMVFIPLGKNEYTESLIPEEFITTVTSMKKLSTVEI